MAWTPADMAKVEAKMHSWFGKWQEGELEALIEEFQNDTPTGFLEACRQFWNGSDKKRKPWPKVLRELMGPTRQPSMGSGPLCMVCRGVACVPVQLLTISESVIRKNPELANQKAMGAKVMHHRDALGREEAMILLPWENQGKVAGTRVMEGTVWCAECAPSGVNPLFVGANVRKTMLPFLRITPAYDFLERAFERIVDGRKIDPNYDPEAEIVSADEIAKDDAFWEERYKKAKSPAQVNALRRFRYLMQKGIDPFTAKNLGAKEMP